MQIKLFFKAQLWKLDGHELKNKEGLWKSSDKWVFKDKDERIYIENISKTKVLGPSNDGQVILEDKDKEKDEQLWEKGVPDIEGYFTLKNKNGKFMTVIFSKSKKQFILEIKGISHSHMDILFINC